MPSYGMFPVGGFCNSVFSPMMSMPSMYSGMGGFYNPFMYMGGCGSGYFNMMMSMQLMQSLMKSLSNITSSWTPSTPSRNYTPSSPTKIPRRYAKNFNVNAKTNLQQLKSVGYNSKKGKKLAETALTDSIGFTGKCAKYVRYALEKTRLSNGMRADGADYGNVLSLNKNFKEISANGLDLKSLPAGCVLVYGRGQAGYSSKYGHVEITTGTGQAVSDGITNNIRPGARVFVPV